MASVSGFGLVVGLRFGLPGLLPPLVVLVECPGVRVGLRFFFLGVVDTGARVVVVAASVAGGASSAGTAGTVVVLGAGVVVVVVVLVVVVFFFSFCLLPVG